MDNEQSQYVIVGGSAAGMAAAHAIREKDPGGTITVLSEEPDRPYFRPLIPFLVSGKKQADGMALEGSGPYRGKNIVVKTGSRVASLDAANHSVVLENGTRVDYAKLLLATGSRPHMPPEIEGTDTEGVFALRTLADARRMAARIDQARHAVMLGGGLLNLKAAFALLERGVKVTLVVYSPEVLSQLMEPEDATLIRKALDDAGLQIMTGVAATAILSGPSGVTGVALNNGCEVACEMVCIGKGVRPNVEFLAGSGIDLDGGIVADRHTVTSLPDVFTAGDVAVTHDPVTEASIMTALWTNAVEMGRCAGRNMAGTRTEYGGTFGILNATQVANQPFVAMGTVHTEGKACEVFRKEGATTYRKLVFDKEGDRLIGAVFVGDITNAGLYRHVIHGRMPTAPIKRQLVDHRLHYGYFSA